MSDQKADLQYVAEQIQFARGKLGSALDWLETVALSEDSHAGHLLSCSEDLNAEADRLLECINQLVDLNRVI